MYYTQDTYARRAVCGDGGGVWCCVVMMCGVSEICSKKSLRFRLQFRKLKYSYPFAHKNTPSHTPPTPLPHLSP